MPVTRKLIIANVSVFAALALFGVDLNAFFTNWGLVPGRFTADFGLSELATVFTSMFLHAGIWHLLANMIFLYFFGRLVERRLGGRRYLALYAVAGLAAAAAQLVIDPSTMVPMVGASGAISGMLGAAMVLAPRERLMLFTPFTLFIPITMSIFTFGLLWLAFQFFGILGAGSTGIAFMAHLGGFAAGYALTRRPKRRPAAHTLGPARRGPAPSQRYRTFFVTDPSGRTFAFHEPV